MFSPTYCVDLLIKYSIYLFLAYARRFDSSSPCLVLFGQKTLCQSNAHKVKWNNFLSSHQFHIVFLYAALGWVLSSSSNFSLLTSWTHSQEKKFFCGNVLLCGLCLRKPFVSITLLIIISNIDSSLLIPHYFCIISRLDYNAFSITIEKVLELKRPKMLHISLDLLCLFQLAFFVNSAQKYPLLIRNIDLKVRKHSC